ncbi:MAG: DEAD/DEAH box helicase [Phycisphaerales bacterium]
MTGTLIVHAAWTGGALHLWGETDRHWSEPGSPFGAEASELAQALASVGVEGRAGSVRLRLPEAGGRRVPSAEMAHALGRSAHELEGEVVLREVVVPSVALGAGEATRALERLDETSGASEGVIAAASVSYLAMLARFSRHLLARQRFVPMARQDGAGRLTGAWRAWMSDEQSARRAAALARAMPPVVRAVVDETRHDAWTILEDFVGAVVDAGCRRTLVRETMIDTIEGQDAGADAQVAWLTGLLSDGVEAPVPMAQRTEAARRIKRWIGALEERGQSSAWRLGFRLNEPLDEDLPPDMEDTSEAVGWSVSFFLQSQEDPQVRVEAADVWLLSRDRATVEGYALDSPQELLLAELGRASRLYKRLEVALAEPEPVDIELSTNQAYEFLREIRPVLVEQGFGVEAPAWWESPVGRLGARLRIESGEVEPESAGSGGVAGASVGLTTLVGYHWEIAIGDTTLTLHEFESFASRSTPLVRVGGRWVEIRPEDVASAIRFIRENPGGQMALSEAMRLAYSSDPSQTGVPVVGMEASGWVSRLLGGSDTAKVELPMLKAPASFRGTLRPYQERGFSWLWFLQRFGLGACLADDMGLGKTIQLLALLLFEREEGERVGDAVDPTLLVVPMSVVGNWMHESKRFAPSLKVLVHHGVERLTGDALVDEAEACDVVVTTYALAHRDRETLERIRWGRVVLDEAQFIKNPAAKQAQAVRALEAPRRVALTGTPVENRLSELWSIMDFLNPGFLGSIGNFRKKFAAPIERYHDQAKGERLRALVRPFILRRVKTDPNVVADLPEKLESKEYCHLTSEQAELYQSCVKRMLSDIDQSEGIQRRGVVLAALIRLKQICNHPSQMLKDHEATSRRPADPTRSGKCIRLLEQLDEALSEGDRALVFTQFRQMGHLLASMLRHELGREILFLHGGTPQGARQSMVEKFQSGESDAPVLILSLKAGGVGLNLTAATHVFHFDRWWNPAVENQATDRAYRIGQTRTVQVHKYVVRGTLEERIDEMIESKMELAENIIGAGERWLTELDTDQLKDILTLRADAVGDEE